MRTRFVLALGAAALLAAGAWYSTTQGSGKTAYKTPEEADLYVRFEMEAYDSIQKNFWKQAPDPDLAALFQLSLQKAAGSPAALPSQDRAGTAKMFASALGSASSTEAKKNLALMTLQIVLYNLPPQGRGELLSTKQAAELRQTVSNVNPEKDLYGDLGLPQGASAAAVDDAYVKKKSELSAATSSEAKIALEKAEYARNVLSDSANKATYDQSKVEPTVSARVLGGTLYVRMTKLAPTTLQEFVRAVDTASTTPLSSMLLDLRGNIGGDLAFAQGFLGLFLGKDQYAFDLFHQGDYQVQRTALPKYDQLSRFREIVILTDRMTQSTAEVLAAAFKRFRLGRVVGEPTRGWGSVENTFPLATSIDPNELYALFLVHSLTLRDDNQPIEQNGVAPDVSAADPHWRAQLSTYVRSPDLIRAIEATMAKPPAR